MDGMDDKDGMVWHGMVWYGMVWHDIMWYGMNDTKGAHPLSSKSKVVSPEFMPYKACYIISQLIFSKSITLLVIPENQPIRYGIGNGIW